MNSIAVMTALVLSVGGDAVNSSIGVSSHVNEIAASVVTGYEGFNAGYFHFLIFDV